MDNIAVFIDGDNISPSDIHLMMDEIRTHGTIIYSALFCDMSAENTQTIQSESTNNGVSLVHCERISGKNSTDIKLIVELMEILHTNDIINLFYIITSDSDFRHVIPRILEKGKKAHCIGSEHTNISLINACTTFTDIEVLRNISSNGKPNTIPKNLKKKY